MTISWSVHENAIGDNTDVPSRPAAAYRKIAGVIDEAVHGLAYPRPNLAEGTALRATEHVQAVSRGKTTCDGLIPV